jgi:microcystin-dependent protein
MLGGQQTTLLQTNMAAHNHTFNVSNAVASSGVPGSGVVLSQGPIESAAVPMYITASPNATMNAGELAVNGSNQPVNLLQPYLCVNYSVALQGLFPSRN